MRREVLSPRWLGIHAAVTAVVVAFVALGLWQLDRARNEARPAAPDTGASAVPLTTLSQPGQQLRADAVGRLVAASGRYDPEQQFLVERPDARWVVGILRTPGGAGLPVVRGSTNDQPVPPAAGDVKITGWLQPSEAGTVSGGSINTAELIQDVPYDLYDGYLVLAAQTPPPVDDLSPVQPPRTSAGDPGFPLQNTAYAIQWWLFAAFAVFLWWRTVRDALRRPADDRSVMQAPIPAQKRPVDG